MTDNRTTELLRKLLRERGVEYTTSDDERAYDEPAKTTWDFVLCGLEMTVTATEFVDVEGKTYLEMDFHHAFTPEQAIAATLGDERLSSLEEKAKLQGDYIYKLLKERDELCGGKLTAEQVRETVEKHWHDLSAEYDMPEATALPEYSYDWQAIADELNAMLGSGTCHMDYIDEYERPSGEEDYLCECSECGSQEWEPAHDLPLYCRKCGKKVER